MSFEPISPISTWSFRAKADKRAIQVPIRARLTVTTAEAAVWAALHGVGVTRVLHYQCAAPAREGFLRIILTKYEVEPLPVHLLHAARGALPSKMRVFLDFAADRLRANLKSL